MSEQDEALQSIILWDTWVHQCDLFVLQSVQKSVGAKPPTSLQKGLLENVRVKILNSPSRREAMYLFIVTPLECLTFCLQNLVVCAEFQSLFSH